MIKLMPTVFYKTGKKRITIKRNEANMLYIDYHDLDMRYQHIGCLVNLGLTRVANFIISREGFMLRNMGFRMDMAGL